MPQPSGRNDSSQRTSRRFAPVLATALILAILLAITYLIAVPVGLVVNSHRLSIPEIILATVILIALAFAAQNEYTEDY